MLAGLGEELAGGVRFQVEDELPSQDADGRVEVGARSVEQLDDGDVEVPVLIGLRSTDTFSGFGGVEATPGAEPAALADEATPGGDGGKDPTDTLGVQGKGTQGHVTERDVLDHASDGGDFLGGELGRGGVRAARPVVEGAVVGEVALGMEAGWREAQDAQGNGERDGLRGGSDGGQDRTLGLTVGHPLRVEAEATQADQNEGKADDGEEESDSSVQGEHLGLQFRTVQGEDIGGDDRARTTADPTGSRRARKPEVLEQAGVALLADEVPHPMVVGTAAGGGRHGAW
jgi:hypothetical protein